MIRLAARALWFLIHGPKPRRSHRVDLILRDVFRKRRHQDWLDRIRGSGL